MSQQLHGLGVHETLKPVQPTGPVPRRTLS